MVGNVFLLIVDDTLDVDLASPGFKIAVSLFEEKNNNSCKSKDINLLGELGNDWGEKKQSSRGSGRSDQKFPKWEVGR